MKGTLQSLEILNTLFSLARLYRFGNQFFVSPKARGQIKNKKPQLMRTEEQDKNREENTKRNIKSWGKSQDIETKIQKWETLPKTWTWVSCPWKPWLTSWYIIILLMHKVLTQNNMLNITSGWLWIMMTYLYFFLSFLYFFLRTF